MDQPSSSNFIFPYKPFAEQLAFHNNPSRFRSMFCGGRGGKTTAGAIEAIDTAMSMPGSFGRIIAPTYRMLEDINVPEIFYWLDLLTEVLPGFKYFYKKSEYQVTLQNGSSFQFRTGEDPRKLRGRGKMDWAWLDEFAYMDEEVWRVIRVRLMDRCGRCWATTTPAGRNWAYEEFWLRSFEDPFFWSIRYPTMANPHIPRSEIEHARRTMDPRYFAQEYMASFEAFEGAVYPEFSLRVHGCNETEIPKLDDLDIILGIDCGFNHPTAMLWMGLSKGDHVYILDEYLEAGRRMSQHADYIKNHPIFQAKDGNIAMYMDPRAAQERVEFGDYGINAIAAKIAMGPRLNERFTRINRVAEYMKLDHRGSSRFHVNIEKCKLLPNAISRYKFDEHGQAEKVNDDLCDSLAYGLSMSPVWEATEHKVVPVYHENAFLNKEIAAEREAILTASNKKLDDDGEINSQYDPFGIGI